LRRYGYFSRNIVSLPDRRGFYDIDNSVSRSTSICSSPPELFPFRPIGVSCRKLPIEVKPAGTYPSLLRILCGRPSAAQPQITKRVVFSVSTSHLFIHFHLLAPPDLAVTFGRTSHLFAIQVLPPSTPVDPSPLQAASLEPCMCATSFLCPARFTSHLTSIGAKAGVPRHSIFTAAATPNLRSRCETHLKRKFQRPRLMTWSRGTILRERTTIEY